MPSILARSRSAGNIPVPLRIPQRTDHVLEHASYAHEGDEAVGHMFRVASGLDSLVLGEPQILSQIRDALDHARDAGAVGPILQRLAHRSPAHRQASRTETDIARNRVSISHAAVDLADHELDGLGGNSGGPAGAGKMATLTGKLLQGPRNRMNCWSSIGRWTGRRSWRKRRRQLPCRSAGCAQAIAGADLVIGAVTVDEPMVTAPPIRRERTPAPA